MRTKVRPSHWLEKSTQPDWHSQCRQGGPSGYSGPLRPFLIPSDPPSCYGIARGCSCYSLDTFETKVACIHQYLCFLWTCSLIGQGSSVLGRVPDVWVLACFSTSSFSLYNQLLSSKNVQNGSQPCQLYPRRQFRYS